MDAHRVACVLHGSHQTRMLLTTPQQVLSPLHHILTLPSKTFAVETV